MKKVFNTLLCSCAISLTTLSHAAQAIIDVTLNEAPNDTYYRVGNIYRASIQYNDLILTGSGIETLSETVSLSFNFNGFIYDESYDQATGFPRLNFQDGELVGIDYWNTQGLTDGEANSFFTFYPDGTFNYSPYGESEYSGQYEIHQIPEVHPSIILLSSIGLILLRRNRCA